MMSPPSFWHDHEAAKETLEYTYTITPIVLILVFVVSFFWQSIALSGITSEPDITGPGGRRLPQRKKGHARRARFEYSPATKATILWLSVALVLTYLINGATVIIYAVLHREEEWWCGKAAVVYIVGTFFVYCLVLISLVDTRPSPTYAQFVPWLATIPLEIVLLTASLTIYTSPHHEPTADDPSGGELRERITDREIVEVVIGGFRLLLLFTLSGIFMASLFKYTPSSEEERESLLGRGNNGNGAHIAAGEYGTAPENGHPKKDAWSRPTETPATTWWQYLKGYSLFFPYLWPAKSFKLQMIVVACFVLVMAQRAINLLVPIQVGKITNILAGEVDAGPRVPWGEIFFFVTLRWLQGSSGLIGSLRSILWIPIGQYSYRELSTASFEHVHGLSLDFHLGKKTGEVISALNKGSAINTFLESITFNVLPVLLDLFATIGYFIVAFDAYYVLVVAIMTFSYLYVTVRMAQWRVEKRREMVNASRNEDAVKNDSLIAYETVKYFNAEQYEFDRFREAVVKYQKAEWHVTATLNALNTTQNTVFMLGVLANCFLASYQVTTGQRRVGDFVALLTLMSQLQQPLNFMGTFYRQIQSALINSERLLELFKEQPTVVDEDGAETVTGCNGDIVFQDVEFAYDTRKAALKGLSFHVPPGKTVALVGESGGGKSTVFRLLFRFYNSASGSIRVDGKDVRDITIDSLRRQIGIVPQDTVLFNESLMYNLKYARPEATDEEVFEACRTASIHENIMSFPDGYDTVVGERGLRLSGGEKQRVAIARTILKNPRIILLDEATAALDTKTEENIQNALSTLSRGRTMLVIAHRLSTITTADQILVLQDGRVHESGSHEELLGMKGLYASMWKKQIRAQKAAIEAQAAQSRAERLASIASGEESGSQSDEDGHRSSQHEHTLNALAAVATAQTHLNMEGEQDVSPKQRATK